MTRIGPAPIALSLTALLAACGPMEDSSDSTAAQELPLGLTERTASGGGVSAIQLSTATPQGGTTVTGTVAAGGGTLVYLSFNKSLFAGPGWVRVPSGQSRATFTLHVSPFVTAPTSTTVSARSTTPDVGGFAAAAVTVSPPATPPATRPQVATATFSTTAAVSGTTITATVALDAPAPATGAPVLVAITNDFLGIDADAPAVVVIPPGATAASFQIRTHLRSGLSSITENVVANLFGGTFQGASILVTR